MSNCGLVTGPASSDLIENQLSAVMDMGNTAYQITVASIGELSTAFDSGFWQQDEHINVSGAALPNLSAIPDFVKPSAPIASDLEFILPIVPPEPPSTGNIPEINFPIAPAFTAVEPSITLPPKPNALSATPPDDPTPLVIPIYPDEPNPIYPNEPVLRTVPLPTLTPPDLGEIETWLAELRTNRPALPDLALSEDLLATIANQYTVVDSSFSAYLNEVPIFATVHTALLNQLAGNSIGISAGVAQTLRERAYGSEDEQAYRAESEVLVDWQSRGFVLPAGPLLARLDDIRQQARDKKAAINRDLWLDEAKLEIQAFQFAIQQGITLEGMYRDSWFKLYDLARTIAGQVFDLRIKIAEVYLERYKIILSGWQIESELVKTQLQAELSKLDVYRSKLEAAKLVGELNRQDIEIYRATLEGIKVRVDVYKTTVDAANAKLSGEVERIRAYGQMIQAYTARVGAYEAEWRAYGQAVQGEQSKTEIYRALVAAFGSRVDAYGKQVDAEKSMGEYKIDVMKLDLAGWAAKVDRFKAELQAEVSRVEATTQLYDSRVKAFGTQAQVEEVAVSSEIKKSAIMLDTYKTRADIAEKEAQLTLQKLLESAKTTVAALDGIARTGSQLSAGALSALNMSASISNSSSFSNSSGCTESYSYEVKTTV